MMPPKSAHLVERAAERLLQAGVLEGSAAQLLEPDRLRAPPPTQPPATDIAASAPAEVLASEAPAQEIEQQAEAASPRPIVDMAALERAGMFDWSRGRSRISEEFRLAQRQMLRSAFAPTAEAGIAN